MTGQIKLGLVTDSAPLEEIADGWDYYEIPNELHILPVQNEANWIRNRDRYRARNVPTLVASHYIGGSSPSGLGTFASGPSYDREQQQFWAARSFRRMHEIGVKVVGVWGEFFQCPDGYDRGKAIDDAISFCNILADEGEKWGIQTALEPNANPDTLFPSYKEGLAFAKLTGRRSIRVMADLNYFLKLNEPLDDIREDPSYCLHVQMAGEGHGFSQPNLVPRTEAFNKLFTILKDIGYDRTVSVASPWYSSTGAEQIDWRYETGITLDYMRKLRDEHFN